MQTSSQDSYEYDSYEFSEPDLDFQYDLQYADTFEPQADQSSDIIDELLPDPVIPDPAIAICHSLDQSKELVQATFGIPAYSLRSHPIPGLVVLPLKDLNLIRKDNRSNRTQSMALILPVGDHFSVIHPDLAQLLEVLNE